MGEGSLYAPNIAALALKQAEGDSMEASFILRAYRATQARRYSSLAVDTAKMRIITTHFWCFSRYSRGTDTWAYQGLYSTTCRLFIIK